MPSTASGSVISIVILPLSSGIMPGQNLSGEMRIEVGVVPFPGVAEKNEQLQSICQESGSWLPTLVKSDIHVRWIELLLGNAVIENQVIRKSSKFCGSKRIYLSADKPNPVVMVIPIALVKTNPDGTGGRIDVSSLCPDCSSNPG